MEACCGLARAMHGHPLRQRSHRACTHVLLMLPFVAVLAHPGACGEPTGNNEIGRIIASRRQDHYAISTSRNATLCLTPKVGSTALNIYMRWVSAPTPLLCSMVDATRTRAGYKDERCAGAGAGTCRSNCRIKQYFKRDLPGIVQRHSLDETPGSAGSAGARTARLFALVRSPWERIMSAFMSKFLGMCSHDPLCFREKYMPTYRTAGLRPFGGVQKLTVAGAGCPRIDGLYVAERNRRTKDQRWEFRRRVNGSVVSVLYFCTFHEPNEWRIFTRCKSRNARGTLKVFAPTVFKHRGKPTDDMLARPPGEGWVAAPRAARTPQQEAACMPVGVAVGRCNTSAVDVRVHLQAAVRGEAEAATPPYGYERHLNYHTDSGVSTHFADYLRALARTPPADMDLHFAPQTQHCLRHRYAAGHLADLVRACCSTRVQASRRV